MKAEVDVISINGTEYVPKSSIATQQAQQFDGMDYVIVRTYSAGVFAGYIESRAQKEVVLRQARRLWYWDGAASLSQLAVDGTSKPGDCKFPVAVNTIILTEAIKIIPCTEPARLSIEGVEIWQA